MRLENISQKKKKPVVETAEDKRVMLSTLMEGVLDATDDDGWMAKSNLYALSKDAIGLHGMLRDDQDLPGWVQSKVATAAAEIAAVRQYMEYIAVNPEAEVVDDVVADYDDYEGEM